MIETCWLIFILFFLVGCFLFYSFVLFIVTDHLIDKYIL